MHRMQETKRLLSVKQTMFHLILGVQKKKDQQSDLIFFSSLGINEDGLYWLRSSRNIVFDDFQRLKALERADLRGKKLKNFKKIKSQKNLSILSVFSTFLWGKKLSSERIDAEFYAGLEFDVKKIVGGLKWG